MKHVMSKTRKVCYSLLALFIIALPAQAQDILTVATDDGQKTYSFEQLTELPQTTVKTKNDYIDARSTFSGPSLKMVLEQNGIGPDAELKMQALNDFSVTVPAADAFNYDVILAVLKDGEKMPIRDKGPIWVIYPMDDHAELRDDLYNGRLVWQLKSITTQ